jgi:hypothetical protein
VIRSGLRAAELPHIRPVSELFDGAGLHGTREGAASRQKGAALPAAMVKEIPSVTSGREGCGRRLVRPPITPDAEGWASVSGLTQREAEELLDWLEANGFSQREVSYDPPPGVTVRWHR